MTNKLYKGFSFFIKYEQSVDLYNFESFMIIKSQKEFFTQGKIIPINKVFERNSVTQEMPSESLLREELRKTEYFRKIFQMD